MSNLKAILWDNDGILVDTEQFYFQATAEIMFEQGVELTKELFRENFLIKNCGAWHLIEPSFDPLNADSDRIAKLKAKRNQRYAELLETESLQIPHALEVVEALSKKYRMCIVTSSQQSHFEQIHSRTALLPYFEFILARPDYERSKPEPDPYLKALERLQLSPQECIVIEDSERGLRAATAAGISCWVIPTDLSEGSDFRNAEKTLENIQELLQFL